MGMLKPGFTFKRITDIDLEKIINLKIKLILLDIDNTLTEHGAKFVSFEVKAWLEKAKKRNIKLVLISNNNKKRVEDFASYLRLDFICDANKPLPFKVNKKIKEKFKKEEILFVGDQIFTDILFANLMGIQSVLLEPIGKNEPLQIRLKRVLEKPFRRL